MRLIHVRRLVLALVIVATAVLFVVVRTRQERRKAELYAAKLEQDRAEVLKIIEQARADAGRSTLPGAGDYDTNWSLRNGAKPPPNSN